MPYWMWPGYFSKLTNSLEFADMKNWTGSTYSLFSFSNFRFLNLFIVHLGPPQIRIQLRSSRRPHRRSQIPAWRTRWRCCQRILHRGWTRRYHPYCALHRWPPQWFQRCRRKIWTSRTSRPSTLPLLSLDLENMLFIYWLFYECSNIDIYFYLFKWFYWQCIDILFSVIMRQVNWNNFLQFLFLENYFSSSSRIICRIMTEY